MMASGLNPDPGQRPRVSVIVPFAGDAAGARSLLDAMSSLDLEPADELVLVDNTLAGVLQEEHRPSDPGRVVLASAEASSYYARNAGVDAAAGEWLLFIDAACRPPAGLIQTFFSRPIADGVGAIAGESRPLSGQRGLLVRWAVTRQISSQERAFEQSPPAALTRNLLVRRAAWLELGGFCEGIRSGGDLEFSWRLRDAGWAIEYSGDAMLEYRHRDTLTQVMRQMARYSAGNAWQERRRPGSVPRLGAAVAIARSLAGALVFAATMRPTRAVLKVVDGFVAVAQAMGRLGANRPPPSAARRSSGESLVIATDRFPASSETFVAGEVDELRRRGWGVRIEAIARPERLLRGSGDGAHIAYLEDETKLDRVRDTAWVLGRHPIRAARDLVERRRMAEEERFPLSAIAPMARRLETGGEGHLHVHFAALACALAVRAGRLTGTPVSFIGHGHDVFATPRAIGAKISLSAFSAGPCTYTSGHLRALAPAGAGHRVHTIVMGIDGQKFRRSTEYPGGRTLVAVGRLVEKKGFSHLVEAVARLEAEAPTDRCLIVGEGPLRSDLERAIADRGLKHRVQLLGRLTPAAVGDVLERADLLVVPSVIAADGDRDAMPVVSKEALAMGVPVVASDDVGLPEVIQEDWGRLVPPGDASALAAAIAELLALSPGARAAMGAAGRRFVLERFTVQAQVERLVGLIAAAAEERRRPRPPTTSPARELT